jgi:pyridoxamine 5'-phosphate oxidase
MRRDYQVRVAGGLTEESLAPTWLEQFRRWFADAAAAPEIVEPNAMIVTTADAAGRPSARTVLLKGVDERGFCFFTNYASRKGTELAANPAVSLLFGWHPIGRQVIVDGRAERVDRDETEAYFAGRPRLAQLAAWASPQSEVVSSRAELDRLIEEAARRFPADVPAPPHWGGIRVAPEAVEFWQGRPNRLHDRLRFRRTDDTDRHWIVERLGP